MTRAVINIFSSSRRRRPGNFPLIRGPLFSCQPPRGGFVLCAPVASTACAAFWLFCRQAEDEAGRQATKAGNCTACCGNYIPAHARSETDTHHESRCPTYSKLQLRHLARKSWHRSIHRRRSQNLAWRPGIGGMVCSLEALVATMGAPLREEDSLRPGVLITLARLLKSSMGCQSISPRCARKFPVQATVVCLFWFPTLIYFPDITPHSCSDLATPPRVPEI